MRRNKQVYTTWVFLVVAAMLIPGCGPSTPDCAKPENFCIGLVTNLGKVNDESFNQLAWEGLKQAERDLGAYAQYIESVDIKDYDKNIATFANAGYDVIVTVGYSQKKITTNAASKYPKIYFIGVDQPQDPDKSLPRNLTGLTFPEDQAGFLAGALAAQMTRSNKIGAVCGPDWFPPASRYRTGFKAGATYIHPAVEVTIVCHNDIGFNESIYDPEWDAATANTMIDNGVDVIFGAGGTDKNGAVMAAAQRDIYAIGVNTDQYLTLREARKVLLSSVIKLITQGVFALIKAARDGNFPGGEFPGHVGYAPFHDLADQVPRRVRVKMDKIQKGLADGSIGPDVTPSSATEIPSGSRPTPTPTATVQP